MPLEFFSGVFLIKLVTLILAISGIWIANHIRKHKTYDAPLVCMVGFDCHTVVHSDYSKFLGFRVEILGIIYYTFAALSYLSVILFPEILALPYSGYIILGLFSLSLIGFLFSAYLIGVQIFILKKGCSWCIVSAFVCMTIFILTSFSYDFTLVTELFR